MESISLISSRSTGLATGSLARRSAEFSDSLTTAMGGERDRTGRDPRAAAEELVAITLVQPILAQLRESDWAAEPFAPSDGEKRFGALYDAEIARRMVKSSAFPLVDALARQMRERSASAGDAAPAGTEAARDDATRSHTHEPLDRTT